MARLIVRPIARFAVFSFTVVGFAITATAHHPDRECQEVRPRIDIIGPLGRRLPPSYRRQLNRPRYLGGKLAYAIAPSSLEAMAWHKADHAGAYANEAGRIEPRYFYPKPWEALTVGPRRATVAGNTNGLMPLGAGEMVPLVRQSEATDQEASSPSDSMALEDEVSKDDMIIDSPTEDESNDEVETLPEPPTSPSDLQLDLPESETRESNPIGSGLERIKQRLQIGGPRGE